MRPGWNADPRGLPKKNERCRSFSHTHRKEIDVTRYSRKDTMGKNARAGDDQVTLNRHPINLLIFVTSPWARAFFLFFQAMMRKSICQINRLAGLGGDQIKFFRCSSRGLDCCGKKKNQPLLFHNGKSLHCVFTRGKNIFFLDQNRGHGHSPCDFLTRCTPAMRILVQYIICQLVSCPGIWQEPKTRLPWRANRIRMLLRNLSLAFQEVGIKDHPGDHSGRKTRFFYISRPMTPFISGI